MVYPINLIKTYRAGEISRADFCRQYAAAQGFNDELKGYSDNSGSYITYRNRTAKIEHGVITWQENGQQYTARSFKELKIKIDILENKAAA